MLREYAATHCGYDVPPAQIGWPAMIYVGETDRQAREEFEPHFWYLAKKGLRLPREYMFPPGHTYVTRQSDADLRIVQPQPVLDGRGGLLQG